MKTRRGSGSAIVGTTVPVGTLACRAARIPWLGALVGTALFLSSFSSPSFGQASGDATRIGSLSAELNGAISAKADALKTISVAQENDAPLAKELKLWDEQAQATKPEIELHKQKGAHHNAEATVVNQKVAAHNAVCTGTLPRPQYERCQGERPYLQSLIDKVHNNKVQLDAERAALLKRANAIDKRRNELVDSLRRIKSQSDQARAQLAAAEQRIAVILPRLQSECQKAGTREAMAHCGQVDWDGARRHVPPPPPDPPWP